LKYNLLLCEVKLNCKTQLTRRIRIDLFEVSNKMKSFKEKVRALFLKEKGLDIGHVEFMAMPKSRKQYNLDKIIGNVNLAEGRYRIKSEADAIVERFLTTPLP